MIYVISDLHGYPVEKLKALLDTAGFGPDDSLYILGDVIDRNGDGGVGVLLWLQQQSNVQLVLGNHETMLLGCDFVFEKTAEDAVKAMTNDRSRALRQYLFNGGGVTLAALRTLPGEKQKAILDYLRGCPLYETVAAGGKHFILVHAGLDNFNKSRKLNDYSTNELMWAWPEKDDEYFEDIHTVFGHTPTKLFDEEYDGRIYRTRTWTCIDCGAGYGNEPVLLRLDDYSVFSLSQTAVQSIRHCEKNTEIRAFND